MYMFLFSCSLLEYPYKCTFLDGTWYKPGPSMSLCTGKQYLPAGLCTGKHYLPVGLLRLLYR